MAFEPSEYQVKVKSKINPAKQYLTWTQEDDPHYQYPDIQIFTDGSKTDTGTAYAFCSYKDNINIHSKSIRINKENTVYQSELLAIKEAINWAESTNFSNIQINSDSLSSIQALENIQTRDLIINDIIQQLQNSTKRYNINWVKGHSGIEGNDKRTN